MKQTTERRGNYGGRRYTHGLEQRLEQLKRENAQWVGLFRSEAGGRLSTRRAETRGDELQARLGAKTAEAAGLEDDVSTLRAANTKLARRLLNRRTCAH